MASFRDDTNTPRSARVTALDARSCGDGRGQATGRARGEGGWVSQGAHAAGGAGRLQPRGPRPPACTSPPRVPPAAGARLICGVDGQQAHEAVNGVNVEGQQGVEDRGKHGDLAG
jgi:hypothetical protein